MTIREFLLKNLTDNGLWPDEAEAVLAQYIENSIELDAKGVDCGPMRDRWNDDLEGYPDAMKAVLALGTHTEAVKWIDANKPKHWARLMFTGEARRRANR